jgi:uncharacterized membrane protein
MKTTSTAFEALMLALVLAPLLYMGIYWNQLPPTLTTQYDWQGNPKNGMSKEMAAFFLGSLSVLLYGLLRYLPRIDPAGNRQPATYQKLRLVVTLMVASTLSWVIYSALHAEGNPAPVNGLLVIISLMLAGMGNYLTTVKPNYFVGFRTPWTLHSTTVWQKTHQLGGRLLFAGGLLGVVLMLVLPAPYQMGIFLGIILVTALTPLVFSYIYYRREKTHSLH